MRYPIAKYAIEIHGIHAILRFFRSNFGDPDTTSVTKAVAPIGVTVSVYFAVAVRTLPFNALGRARPIMVKPPLKSVVPVGLPKLHTIVSAYVVSVMMAEPGRGTPGEEKQALGKAAQEPSAGILKELHCLPLRRMGIDCGITLNTEWYLLSAPHCYSRRSHTPVCTYESLVHAGSAGSAVKAVPVVISKI